MFTLYLKNDPAAAFPLATANWTIQRAPVDARLVLEATLGAKRAREVGKVVAWVKANRIGTTKSWAAPSRSEAEDRRHFRAPPSTASVHAGMVVHECVVAALVQEMRLTVPFD